MEDIHQGKSEHYGAETLREILKLLPESEEVRAWIGGSGKAIQHLMGCGIKTHPGKVHSDLDPELSNVKVLSGPV